ncbi:MAG: hypothetical protein HON70_30275 [Lentisphaerae bacterium]|jgi:hypothetical protein|nr:hypothetical protein [Lentisphaerota bacterium]
MRKQDKEVFFTAFGLLAQGLLLVLQRANPPKADEWSEQTFDFLEGELTLWLDRKG